MGFGAQPLSSLSVISCLRQSCCASPCWRKTVSTPPLFICCSVFQLNSGAGAVWLEISFSSECPEREEEGEEGGREAGRGSESAEETAEYVRHICLLCLVTLQWEDGDTHFLHLMCLLLQPMPSVNMQLLDSHFSFETSSRVERAANRRQTLSVHFYGFVFILFCFCLFFLGSANF